MQKRTRSNFLTNTHISHSLASLAKSDEGEDSSILKKKHANRKQRPTGNLTSGLFKKVERLNEWVLDTNHAVSNMASKVRPRLKFFSPYVDEKILRSLQKRVSPRRTSQELEATKGRLNDNM